MRRRFGCTTIWLVSCAVSMPSTANNIHVLVERLQSAAGDGRVRLQRIPAFGTGFRSIEAEQRNGAPLLAGGLAYRLFFWLVAFGLLVAAAMSFWVRGGGEKSPETTAKAFGLAGVAARSAVTAVENGSNGRWYYLISGSFLLVYFGVGAVRALRLAAVLAWRLEPMKMRKPLRASLSFSGFVVALVIAGLGGSWLRHNGPGGGITATVVTTLLIAALALFAFMLLPHAAIDSWRRLLPGALLVAFGLTAMNVFVTYYMAAKLQRSPKLYGSLGASTVVLLWLFLLARLVVSGMFLNATVNRRHGIGVA